MNKLVDLLLREIISESNFQERKANLKNSICRLKEKREKISKASMIGVDETAEAFEFASNARKIFVNGDLLTKKTILSNLGNNFILQDGKISLQLAPWFKIMEENISQINRDFRRLEPNKKSITKSKSNASVGSSCIWFTKAFFSKHFIANRKKGDYIKEMTIKLHETMIDTQKLDKNILF